MTRRELDRQRGRGADGDDTEYACHEGNYAMTYILRGARAEEARALEQNTSEN